MEAEFTVDEIQDLQESVATLSTALESELDSAATDIAERLVGDASRDAPVDTSRLASDISSVLENIATAIIRIRVGSNLDYAEPMEKGTDPFFPPPDELRRWAHRVLGDEDLAFVVARSISEEGLEAREFIADAFEGNSSLMIDRAEQAVDNAFSEAGLL